MNHSVPPKFLLSIIIPVYNEEKNIEPLIKKLVAVSSQYSYEILFIDDGSTDRTTDAIKKIATTNHAIKLISFTRNFGHQMAQTAGYEKAQGDCVVTIDADLQDPPQLIDDLIEQWRKGFKIVYARREKRNDSWFKRCTAYFFYRVINFLSDTPIPEDIGDFRLLDRSVVQFLNMLPERSRFLRGLVAWAGFSSTHISFIRSKRHTGQTHYPLTRMINFALDGITSFSTKPLKLASYAGFLTSTIGIIGIIYALYRRFFLPHEYWVTGWTALFVAVMFFGGIQLLTIGIIGEYIGKMYQEIQRRPQFLIKETVNVS
ncbi:MAG TPA: glycosyltransferase family 2 protein [Patescibacteria group bacterium]|nr:glycosyltransferase family 2 protein [Patescibacteria group bacterium]